MITSTGNAAQEIIVLGPAQPFGVGGRRLCYEHPTDRTKCVKVLRQDDRRTVRMAKSSGWIPAALRRVYDNNADEMQTLEYEFQRIGPTAKLHLPESFGMHLTDQGPGLVLDLVRDADGRISRSLRELLSTGYEPQLFRPAYDELSDFLRTHRVITRTLLDHNIAAQHRADGTWRLVIIDGLGDPALLPLARWIPALGRSKIERRIAEAWPRFEKFYRSGGVTADLIQSSSWGQGFLNHRGDSAPAPASTAPAWRDSGAARDH